MSSSKGSSAMRNMMYGGRNSLLPPKCPFPSPAPAYGDYVPSSVIGPKATAKAFPGNPNHQRTSSESLLIDEQPSWLDELLNEPETPVRRGGHRRSSSDSFAYIEAANAASFDFMTQDDIRFNNLMPASSWGPQDFDHFRDAQRPFVPEINAFTKHRNRPWDASPNSIHHLRGIPPPGNNLQNPGTYRPQQEADVFPVAASEKQDNDSSHQDMKGSFEKKDSSNGKPAACETDTKRAKQQFAQRSRVRKLQYIAELERNVQALQVEGVEVSAELEFLNQQHLILSMENKALKQRLESLAQEQLIKYVEHDVLERELGRLRALYQQQQPPPLSLQPQKHQTPGHQRRGSKDFDLQHQVSGHQRKSSRDLDLQHQVSGHQRKSSRDLDLQLANLSLKQQTDNTSSACDHVPRQLNI